MPRVVIVIDYDSFTSDELAQKIMQEMVGAFVEPSNPNVKSAVVNVQGYVGDFDIVPRV